MNALKSEYVAEGESTPVIVLFGGNPYRRHEVVSLIESMGQVTVYGTLSEAEGMAKIQALPRVDLVLIGGRYTQEQRQRIRRYVQQHLPNASITEPGVDYPYHNASILADIQQRIMIK